MKISFCMVSISSSHLFISNFIPDVACCLSSFTLNGCGMAFSVFNIASITILRACGHEMNLMYESRLAKLMYNIVVFSNLYGAVHCLHRLFIKA